MDKKRLVLIGGGHAHLTILAGICKLTEQSVAVTVIQPSTHHYYSGMGAGMLGMTYAPEQIRFHTKRVVEKGGGTFVLGRARRIHAAENRVELEDGREIFYDVLSCNAGSGVPQNSLAIAGKDIFPVKPIEGLLAAQQRFLALSRERSLQIGVIGGGPSAVEISGNLRQLAKRSGVHLPVIRIVAGRRLLPRDPARVRELTLRFFGQRSIAVLEGRCVVEAKEGSLLLDDGRTMPFDMVFLAMGVKPSPLFAESGLPIAPDGGLRVNRFLQCTEQSAIFGGGDCIHFEPEPLDKVGVYAVRENPVLAYNVAAALRGEALRPFSPGSSTYLLIYNLGEGACIFRKGALVFNGRLAFFLKDYIDRRFMRKYQAAEH